jgi:hypothetical protein
MRKPGIFTSMTVASVLAVLTVLGPAAWHPSAARADSHVLGTLAVQPAPEWGRKATALTMAREWWFGTGVMAFVTEGWRYVFDRNRGRILVINTRDGYFMEASMTAYAPDLVDPKDLPALNRFQVHGTVAPSLQKKTVLSYECRGYAVSEWILNGTQHFFDRDRTIYACPDVPFDWTLNRDLRLWMISFFHPQMAYFGGLRSIQGFPMSEADIFTRRGQMVHYGTEITAVEEAAPPDGVYAVPGGFERHEKLVERDLTAMRQILYLIYYF